MAPMVPKGIAGVQLGIQGLQGPMAPLLGGEIQPREARR